MARLPTWTDFERLRHPGRPLWLERPPRLEVLSLRALPIDPLPAGERLNAAVFWRAALGRLAAGDRQTIIGIGRPTALARMALEAVPHAWSFYDAMDLFPEFYRGLSRRHTRATEIAIASTVTRVFASSQAIADKVSAVARSVTLMRNAYDMDLLDPADAGSRASRNTLGFLGCVGHWFDWDLALRVAQAAAPLKVALVGPRPSAGPSRLPDNMTWEGERHQSDTVPHLSTFAAGLIPFKCDNLTMGVDPIKYYQYRGAGLPVLTTPFGEMQYRNETDDTFMLTGNGDLRSVINRALLCRPTPGAIGAFRASNTWEARFRDARALEPTG